MIIKSSPPPLKTLPGGRTTYWSRCTGGLARHTKVMIIKSAKVLPHNSKVVLTQIYTPAAQTTHNITEHSHTRSLVQKHNICWWWWSECWWKWKKGGMRCWPGAPVMIILMGSALSQRLRNLLEENCGNSFHRNLMKSALEISRTPEELEL